VLNARERLGYITSGAWPKEATDRGPSLVGWVEDANNPDPKVSGPARANLATYKSTMHPQAASMDGVTPAFSQTLVDSKGDSHAPGNSKLVTQSQPGTLRNSTATAATNTAVTTSIAAVAGQSVRLYAVQAYCSAGTASVSIKDAVGGTVIWTIPAVASPGQTFFTPFTNASAAGMDIVLATCGVSNTGTLNVQSSQF
jgi:hypothetical protein